MSNKPDMRTLAGLPTARGFSYGPVFIYRGDGEIPVPEYQIELGRVGDEQLRLKRAILDAKRDLENLISVLRVRAGQEDVRVFEAHLMMLEDEILLREASGYIVEKNINAEAAVRKTAAGVRAQFSRMNDAYFRERVRDVDDVERRLLKSLLGFAADPSVELKAPAIVVADDLTPSETVQLPREYVLGFAMNGGSTTSHVALLARAMGIPAVTGLGNITSLVKAGETIVLDGTNGTVTLNPDSETILRVRDFIERQKELSEEASLGRTTGSLRDGESIGLLANVQPGVPFSDIAELGVRGIGLYRTEYLWLKGEGEPSEDEQYAAYREAVEFVRTISPTARVAIRALDIGGDKMVRGISQRTDAQQREANPFLGNRSIRYLLSHPDVFRVQLRAVLRASAGGNAALMYPMVSCVEELLRARAILDDVKADLAREGHEFDRDLPIGMMIEVPSAALNAATLARHVSFFSIGTNDLIQYTMAADRGNESVANLYQPLNPAVLRLIEMTIEAARAQGIPVSVCGESASDPIAGVLWVAMGVSSLSMSASYVPMISKLLSRLSRADLNEYRSVALEGTNELPASEIIARCRAWLQARIPDLDNIII